MHILIAGLVSAANLFVWAVIEYIVNSRAVSFREWAPMSAYFCSNTAFLSWWFS